MNLKRKRYPRKPRSPGKKEIPIRSEVTEAPDWDAFYRSGKIPWRSSGLGRIARQFLSGAPRGGKLLEVGCGTGDDAQDLIKLGFDYTGIDSSTSAIAQAKERLKGLEVNLVCANFLLWKPKKRYAIIYEKGVFHGVEGLRQRRMFARQVGVALDEQGIWITISGAADGYNPQFPHGAIFLTHLAEAIEPYFEILEIVKAPYGMRNPVHDFGAWYGLFRRRG
jgi:SAM-dependent methyltransferase